MIPTFKYRVKDVKAGCFARNARARWCVAFHCEVGEDLPTGNGCVGIDLGLTELATLGTGDKVPALKH